MLLASVLNWEVWGWGWSVNCGGRVQGGGVGVVRCWMRTLRCLSGPRAELHGSGSAIGSAIQFELLGSRLFGITWIMFFLIVEMLPENGKELMRGFVVISSARLLRF